MSVNIYQFRLVNSRYLCKITLKIEATIRAELHFRKASSHCLCEIIFSGKAIILVELTISHSQHALFARHNS
jgi:hypothetical protein